MAGRQSSYGYWQGIARTSSADNDRNRSAGRSLSSSMRQTTHCVACRTPISIGEPTCWACGVVQARPAPPPPPAAAVHSSDPYHRNCPRCHHSVAVYHHECKNCGHALGRSTHTLPTDLPSGWVVTPLTDGSIQLKQTTWNRINHSGQFLGGLIMVGAFLIIQSTPRGYRPPYLAPEHSWVSLISFLIIAVLAVVYLVWITMGTEYWRVAPGLLGIHKECLGRKWGPRFTQAELLIRTEWRYRRRTRERVCVLAARGGGRDCVLSEIGLSGVHQLQSLGSYLAAQTGWPLQLPMEWPPTPGLWGLF